VAACGSLRWVWSAQQTDQEFKVHFIALGQEFVCTFLVVLCLVVLAVREHAAHLVDVLQEGVTAPGRFLAGT